MLNFKELIISASEGQKRSINAMKGMGVMIVVIVHLSPTYAIKAVLCSFFMPLFFILSGYFYKPVSFKVSLKNNYERLVKPYLFCSIICISLLFITGSKGREFMDVVFPYLYVNSEYRNCWIGGHFPKMFGLWFLPALFWCRITYNFLNSKEGVLLSWGGVVTLLVAITATIIDNYFINLPFNVLPGLSAMTFYLIGHRYKVIKKWRFRNCVIILCLICWVLAAVFSRMRMVCCRYDNYILDVFGACGGVYAVYIFSNYLVKIKYLSDFVIWVGRLSMCFYCIHCIDFTVFPLSTMPELHWGILFIIKMVIYTMGVYIMCHVAFFRKLFGIKV